MATTEPKSLLAAAAACSLLMFRFVGLQRETDAVCHGAQRSRTAASLTANPVAWAGMAAEASVPDSYSRAL